MATGLFNSSERVFLLHEELLIKKDKKQGLWANSYLGEEGLKINEENIFRGENGHTFKLYWQE